MNRSMFTSGVTTALSVIAAAALVACGGGNDDPATNPLTEGQAKSLAATTIHAVLTADHVANLVTTQSLDDMALHDEVMGAAPSMACASGEAQFQSTDTDNSASLSTGDLVSTTFKACQSASAAGWVLDGDTVLSVTAGDNVHHMWFAGADGKIALKLSANGIRMGGGTSLAGDWRFDATRSGGVVSQGVQFAAATFGSRDMTSQFDGVGFAVDGTGLHSLTGQVRTSVIGYGDVAVTLSQAAALTLDAAQSLRYAPKAGTVMLDAAAFRIAVVYGEQGVITLQVDQGKGNSVDLEVVTSVQELDALLKAPLPVADAAVAVCADADALGGSARISDVCAAHAADALAAVRAATLARPAPVIWQNRLPLPRALLPEPQPKKKAVTAVSQ